MNRRIIHYEEAIGKAGNLLASNKIPFFATMLIGLLTHIFMFTNKLVNLDDIFNLFDKGTSVTSGRWGLELLRGIFPDYSMPWFYGIISLLLLSVSVCMTLHLFSIRSHIVQILFAGVAASFPALTGVFSYMFTSAPYMLAMLLAICAVVLCEKGGKRNTFFAAVCAFFSLSIYQAFISIVAGFFVLVLIRKMIRKQEEPAAIIRTGLLRVLFLLVILVAYYAGMKLTMAMTHSQFNDYASENFTTESINIVRRVYVAFVNFMYFFTQKNWGLINTPLSLVMHLTALGVSLLLLLKSLREQGLIRTLLLGFLGVMLVLAMNSMYLVVEEEAVHTLALFGFISLYLFFAIVLEELTVKHHWGRDLILLSLTLIILNNIFIANKCYLRLHMEYEQAYGILNSVVTQIKQTEGFDETKTVAIIGNYDMEHRSYPWFDDEKILGTDDELVNVYSRDHFLRFYLGFDVPYATEEEKAALSLLPTYEAMPLYPYYGSVQLIGDYIVVKLGG